MKQSVPFYYPFYTINNVMSTAVEENNKGFIAFGGLGLLSFFVCGWVSLFVVCFLCFPPHTHLMVFVSSETYLHLKLLLFLS